jgi:hypothetical protein
VSRPTCWLLSLTNGLVIRQLQISKLLTQRLQLLLLLTLGAAMLLLLLEARGPWPAIATRPLLLLLLLFGALLLMLLQLLLHHLPHSQGLNSSICL